MTNDSRRWAHLGTEGEHPQAGDLDRRTTAEVVELLLREDRNGLDRALEQRSGIAEVARRVAETLRCGGRLLFAGAGTSGRLGVLEAAECPPTFGTDPELVRAVIAGGESAVFRAVEGAEDDEAAGRDLATADLEEGDLLIAISASSVTPFALGALRGAASVGAATVLLTCASNGRIDATADLVVALDTGPEVLSGSTRLKAGSATKATLNAITTAAMVELGKVYGSKMVDLRQGSAKLRDRAVRIVAETTESSIERAADLLEQADGEVKTAIAMAELRVGAEEARRRIERANGRLREALDNRRGGD